MIKSTFPERSSTDIFVITIVKPWEYLVWVFCIGGVHLGHSRVQQVRSSIIYAICMAHPIGQMYLAVFTDMSRPIRITIRGVRINLTGLYDPLVANSWSLDWHDQKFEVRVTNTPVSNLLMPEKRLIS
jgi:hypothetical protein